MDDVPPVCDAGLTLGSDPLGEDPLTGEIPCFVSLCVGVVDTVIEGPLTEAPLDTGDPDPLSVGEAAALCVSVRPPAL